ncbi:hypothetical protein DUNSADRAFT_11600 [Dunaliella salina]|uniref:Encoded protein n=1 Tax=Dunaliella salina TaxID=3046 RepID=A0ABQ7GD28_DUNSA|nr:hypothetical protein DUNSADRAFT_11600 [Dunaliella salina]|eukprot:KAF5832500.1 hypothetical protein DUNSADRAFT_11600 [Dunaliella salina]
MTLNPKMSHARLLHSRSNENEICLAAHANVCMQGGGWHGHGAGSAAALIFVTLCLAAHVHDWHASAALSLSCSCSCVLCAQDGEGRGLCARTLLESGAAAAICCLVGWLHVL